MHSEMLILVCDAVNIVIGNGQLRMREDLQVQIHMGSALLIVVQQSAAGVGMSLAPVADATDIHVTQQGLTVVSQCKCLQEVLELFQENRIKQPPARSNSRTTANRSSSEIYGSSEVSKRIHGQS